GDVLPGPMPNETIECLLNLDIPVQLIQGNGDRVVLAQMRSTESSEVPEQFREVVRWVARQLHPEHERLLASWPKKCRVEIRGIGEVLFCHATPRNMAKQHLAKPANLDAECLGQDRKSTRLNSSHVAISYA